MPIAQQRAYVRLRDPIAYAWADNAQADDGTGATTTVLLAALTDAAAELSATLYKGRYDLAVALLALVIIRRNNPNIGAGAIVSNADPVSGSVSKSAANLPKGYPAHWYTTPAGEELIGLSWSLSPPSFG